LTGGDRKALLVLTVNINKMIKFNETYSINNGQESIVFKEVKGNTVTGEYQGGTLTGTMEGNVLKATYHNQKNNSVGMIEITFSENGFSAKWKQGLEPGPMRGKWKGLIKSKSEINSIENSEEKEVVIEISGRIPKYFFGSLKKDFQEEIKNVLEYCSEELSTEEEFLQILLLMTLEDKETAREDFFSYIEESDLEENFPNLNRLVIEMEEYDYDHFALYEELFDTAEYWDGGTGFISFFESDANIRILIDNKEIVQKQNLASFFKSIESGNTEEGPTSKLVESFIEKNIDHWGLSESLSFTKNSHGCYLIDDWFAPQSLSDLSEQDDLVTIEHDDIITYSYSIFSSDFKFEDLLFLSHSNYSDFRKSSEDTLFNFLFYKNEIVTPDESLERDKGIILKFKPKLESLSFLLNG
jgi:hypothetical protein